MTNTMFSLVILKYKTFVLKKISITTNKIFYQFIGMQNIF